MGGTHVEFINVEQVWNINNGVTNMIIHFKLLPIKAMANMANIIAIKYVYGPRAKVLVETNFKNMWVEHRWIMGGPQVEFTYMWWTIFGTWVERRKWSSLLQVQLILESLFVRCIIYISF
jgi:hypothetical protein